MMAAVFVLGLVLALFGQPGYGRRTPDLQIIGTLIMVVAVVAATFWGLR